MSFFWFNKKRRNAEAFIAQLAKIPESSLRGGSSEERATAITSMFGGMHVGEIGKGQDLAKSDVRFFSASVREDELVERWTGKLGQLSAIATAHYDHMTVFVDQAGQFYAFADPTNVLYPIGSDFRAAMECLLLGKRYGPPVL